jgi:hypothetical protein
MSAIQTLSGMRYARGGSVAYPTGGEKSQRVTEDGTVQRLTITHAKPIKEALVRVHCGTTLARPAPSGCGRVFDSVTLGC